MTSDMPDLIFDAQVAVIVLCLLVNATSVECLAQRINFTD